MLTCDFLPGETLYTCGLNMRCKPVVTKVKFVRLHSDGRVVTESRSGIKVIGGRVTEHFKRAEDVPLR